MSYSSDRHPSAAVDQAFGIHLHMCPECFDHVRCDMDCSVNDWSEGYGSPSICDRCEQLTTFRAMHLGGSDAREAGW